MNRPLSALEHVLWQIDQVVPQNFVLVVRISSKSTPLSNCEPVFRQALDLVQQRHPPLRCKIKKEDVPRYTASAVPKIPLSVKAKKDDHQWLEAAEKEMMEALPWEQGPLTRVMLLHSDFSCDLLFTFCHVVADASSGVHVVHNFLRIADKLLRGESNFLEPPLPELPSSLDLLREDVIRKANSPDRLEKDETATAPGNEPVDLNGDVIVSPDKRITRIVQRKLSKAETGKLVTRCKNEDTSVHGALCAALLQVVIEQVRESKNVPQQGPLMIGCTTPVDIRHLFARPLGEDVGDFISDALHYQLIDDHSSLWISAREVKKSLQKVLESREDIKAVLHVEDFLKSYSNPLDMAIALSQLFPPVAVTNLGRLDIPEKFEDLIQEELHFTLSINPGVKNGIAMAVTTFRGCMTINFLYSEPYLAKERAMRLIEKTMFRLKEAIK